MTSEPARFVGSNLKRAHDHESGMALLDAAVDLSAEDERQCLLFPFMVFVAEAVERVAGGRIIIGPQGHSSYWPGTFTGGRQRECLPRVR